MTFYSDGKGKPADDPTSPVWYHGSPLVLEVLAAGSSITRNRDLAVAFSHKPTQLSIDDDGVVRHNGRQDGYLYEIDEPVSPNDLHVHEAIRRDDPWEWITERPYRLRRIERTEA